MNDFTNLTNNQIHHMIVELADWPLDFYPIIYPEDLNLAMSLPIGENCNWHIEYYPDGSSSVMIQRDKFNSKKSMCWEGDDKVSLVRSICVCWLRYKTERGMPFFYGD